MGKGITYEPGMAVGACPLSGVIAAANSPADKVPSHGTDAFGQRYAFDFAVVADRPEFKARQADLYLSGSSLRHSLSGLDAAQFRSWQVPVRSPLPGRVVAALDGWPDRRQCRLVADVLRGLFPGRPATPDDIRPLVGNAVVIDSPAGFVLLAHLREGSLAVDPGAHVEARERIGLVGNSGNSMLPHLHVHLMDSPDMWTAAGLPLAFRGLAGADGSSAALPLLPRRLMRYRVLD